MASRELDLISAGDVLRFTTAGSVDDGKSTLIGRLLLDAKGLLEDQLAAVARTTARAAAQGLDLSLFTDGLTAEREQGITIDVAYRYFATPKRRFIIADTPGHEQYTRNMVTGSSTADVSVILVDATRGISQQTRRHAAVASLLAIPRVVVAVNKMDQVGFDRAVFEEIAADFAAVSQSLGLANVSLIPLSALEGDMVVERGEHLGWYEGPTLLEVLETAKAGEPSANLRFPVQLVSRSRFGDRQEHRGYLGRVESGTLAVGDTVVAWPHGLEARVADIVTLDGTLRTASAGPLGHRRPRPPGGRRARRPDFARARRALGRAPLRRASHLARPRSALARAGAIGSSTARRRCARRSNRCIRASTSARCSPTSARPPSPSTTLARCASGSRVRSSRISTRTIAPPAASSSSTRRRTTRWPAA